MNTFLFLMLKFQLLESIEIANLVHIETIKCNMLFLIGFFCVCMLTFSTSFISFLIVPVSASKSFKLKPQKRKKEVSEEKKGKNSEEERLIHDCEPRTHYTHDSRPKTEINLDGKMHLKSDVHKTRQGKDVIRNIVSFDIGYARYPPYSTSLWCQRTS